MESPTIRAGAAGPAEHVPKMWRVACRILGREDLAAEAVQDALITYHQSAALVPNAEAWLLRTVTHRSLALRRADRRRRRYESAAPEELAGRRAGGDPERELSRRELADRIAAALRGLPFEQREAFLLREIYGLDYNEISSAQRVPVGTVRSRLSRARHDLRDSLGVQP